MLFCEEFFHEVVTKFELLCHFTFFHLKILNCKYICFLFYLQSLLKKTQVIWKHFFKVKFEFVDINKKLNLNTNRLNFNQNFWLLMTICNQQNNLCNGTVWPIDLPILPLTWFLQGDLSLAF